MLKTLKSLQEERVVNIRDLQKSPSNSLKGITRILRGKNTLGYFLDPQALDDLIEDMEATKSPTYLKRIAAARKDKTRIPLTDVLKEYGI